MPEIPPIDGMSPADIAAEVRALANVAAAEAMEVAEEAEEVAAEVAADPNATDAQVTGAQDVANEAEAVRALSQLLQTPDVNVGLADDMAFLSDSKIASA